MQNSTGNITQAIVEKLGMAIVSGHYDDGESFPNEAQLCEQLNVSRSVLREAIKMLTARGLLVSRPRKGTHVQPERNWNLLDPSVLRWLLNRKFSIDLLLELSEIRYAIEPQAAFYAAQRITPEAMKKIDAALDRMIAASVGDDDPLLSDIAFHVAILDASQNRFYWQLHNFIDTALRFSIRFTNQSKGVHQADIGDHKAVADGIRAADPQRASQAMQALLDEAMELMRAAQANKRTDKPLASMTG